MDNGLLKSAVLLSASPLISESYRQEQAKLHAVGNYGVVGAEHAPMVDSIIAKLGITHLLDYGCGSRLSLGKSLKCLSKITYQAYDPAVPKFSTTPVPAEMVVCCDVLEHIEPDCLDAVLDDLVRVTDGVLFATIATGPAGKWLSDGRNAHLIQEDMRWWLPRLWDRFELQTVQILQSGSFLVIAHKKSAIDLQ